MRHGCQFYRVRFSHLLLFSASLLAARLWDICSLGYNCNRSPCGRNDAVIPIGFCHLLLPKLDSPIMISATSRDGSSHHVNDATAFEAICTIERRPARR
jgi:hypothetical protein